MRKATIFAGKKTASKKVVRKKAVKQPKATPKKQASGRSSYWAVYPRNFANEYDLYKVPAGEKNKFTEWSEDYINDPNADVVRITAKDARKMSRAAYTARGNKYRNIRIFGEDQDEVTGEGYVQD